MEVTPSEHTAIDVLILAAGLGTRMRSGIAKVLHAVDGRPLIEHVCRSASSLAPEKIYVVVGHQAPDVQAAVEKVVEQGQAVFVRQEQQLGTGDAVNSARKWLEDRDTTVVILSGDVPLIRPETLAALVQQHRAHRGSGAACTILTVKLKDPTGYGRIIRGDDGTFDSIVEQKDATDEQREVREINAGIYCFESRSLFAALNGISNNNSQGEYYLTDVPRILKKNGERVAIYQHSDPHEIEGVNDRSQLADINRLMRRRTVARLMLDHGVTFIDPKTSYVSDSVTIGRDTVIHPNVTLEGTTSIGDACVIRPGTRISNSRIGSGVEILDNCLIVDSEVEADSKVGPMAHLRGHASIGPSARIGNFVEVKKSRIGHGSKASHLTYLGDATIGENTNIGAGTITCNYDGKNKNETRIGDNVRIGSDTMLVAPVTVGDGASTGAGSVVTKDVGPGDLVVGVPAKSISERKKATT